MKKFALFLKNPKKISKFCKEGLAMISIDLFWGSIGESDGISHQESKVWKKSWQITHAYFEHDPRLHLILRIYFDPFARDEQSVGVGSIGSQFWWFLPPTFHQISYIICHNLANVTNTYEFYMFGWLFGCRNLVYKNWTKWWKSQAGRRRPGWPAYQLCRIRLIFVQSDLEHKSKPNQFGPI